MRAMSAVDSSHRHNVNSLDSITNRRLSHDVKSNAPVMLDIDVDATWDALRSREDTDSNFQITRDDKGPKYFWLGTHGSGGYLKHDVRGTYYLSNLLQELERAREKGKKHLVIPETRLNENPVSRLDRIIRDDFWPNLTRRIDGSNIAQVGMDPKDWTGHPRPRIYIPVGAPEQHEYYTRIAKEHPQMNLDVQWLSTDPGNEEYVRDLNDAPGLLALEMERVKDTANGERDYRGLPFIVPGGRFNELYGWDSYMASLGLLIHDKVDLAENMVRHFCFCIKHYSKILNANRSYYLCRTQPPFLTDMALRVYERISHRPDAKEFLRLATLSAIKEYYSVWTSAPRFDPESGLSRYRAQGMGVPPETEASHFEHVLQPYADKHKMSYKDFIHAYNHGHVFEPELDKFFIHDRAVRESGHDTSYRLENVAADLAVVDLNSCLFKYESDIKRIIAFHFNGKLEVPAAFCAKDRKPGYIETPTAWEHRAKKRKALMDKHMWDEAAGMYFDYDCVKKQQTGYESVTTFWAMWAGVASPAQAAIMVKKALPLFEEHGGLVAGTKRSRGNISLSRPNRQWDYPYGWAPQQILAWTGLLRYRYEEEAQRLAYRWLYMVTVAAVDFNGVVVEKYDVTNLTHPHQVAAEYGNQGADFKGRAKEGFGWVNASYVYGLQLLDTQQQRALGALVSWDDFARNVIPDLSK